MPSRNDLRSPPLHARRRGISGSSTARTVRSVFVKKAFRKFASGFGSEGEIRWRTRTEILILERDRISWKWKWKWMGRNIGFFARRVRKRRGGGVNVKEIEFSVPVCTQHTAYMLVLLESNISNYESLTLDCEMFLGITSYG